MSKDSGGQFAMLSEMPPFERQILTAPDLVARAAASAAPDRRSRWMLRQPRAVRLSYARECFGRPDEERRAQAWMLMQPEEVRASYVAHVLDAGERPR